MPLAVYASHRPGCSASACSLEAARSERHALHFHQQALAIAAGERSIGMGEVRVGLDRLDEHLARDLERALAPAAVDQERATDQVHTWCASVLVVGGAWRALSAATPSGADDSALAGSRPGEPQPGGQMLEIRRHLVGFLAHQVGGGEIRRIQGDPGGQRTRRLNAPGQRLCRRAIGPHPHRRRGIAREGGERILVAPRIEIGRAEQVPGPAGIEERIDLLGQLEPADALLRPAEIRTGERPSPPARRASWD